MTDNETKQYIDGKIHELKLDIYAEIHVLETKLEKSPKDISEEIKQKTRVLAEEWR